MREVSCQQFLECAVLTPDEHVKIHTREGVIFMHNSKWPRLEVAKESTAKMGRVSVQEEPIHNAEVFEESQEE